eukprot:1155681-Pelagomonas_calceolata.AAC.4
MIKDQYVHFAALPAALLPTATTAFFTYAVTLLPLQRHRSAAACMPARADLAFKAFPLGCCCEGGCCREGWCEGRAARGCYGPLTIHDLRQS